LLLIAFGTLNPAKQSGTGFLFESDNIACASPTSTFNIGATFTFAAWVYFTDITTEQVIWCKTMILTSGAVSQRACVKVFGNNIVAGVNGAASSSMGSYTEVNTLVTPELGWNFVVVGFDTTPSSSSVQAWVYMPDGTSASGP